MKLLLRGQVNTKVFGALEDVHRGSVNLQQRMVTLYILEVNIFMVLSTFRCRFLAPHQAVSCCISLGSDIIIADETHHVMSSDNGLSIQTEVWWWSCFLSRLTELSQSGFQAQQAQFFN